MHFANIHEAKTHFSKLIALVEGGDEIVIGKAGTPIARITPYVKNKKRKRVPGLLKGKIKWHGSQEEADKEIESLFYDGPIFPDERL